MTPSPPSYRGGASPHAAPALEWARLHRWLAAAMAGLAVGFLARTGRLDTTETSGVGAALQAELSRSSAALLAAERASRIEIGRDRLARSTPPQSAAASAQRRPASHATRRTLGHPSDAAAGSTSPAGAASARSAHAPAPVRPLVDASTLPAAPAAAATAAATEGDAADGAANELTAADVGALLEHFRQAYERRNAEDMALLFSADAIENGRVGREAIARAYEQTFGTLESVRYVMRQPEIQVDGDTAEAIAPVTMAFVDTAGRSWAVDTLVHWWIVRTPRGMTITRMTEGSS